MPLDFPNTSTTGTVYTGTNNVVYIYDGVRWNGNGTGSLIPPINLTYDLGSTSSQWLNLYVGNAYVNGQPVGSVTTGTTAPTGGLGKLWYNPDVGRLYIYYDSYWVDASPPVGSSGGSGGSGGTIDLTAVTTDVLPNTNLTYNLGSPSKQWRSLYVGTSTIYIGGTALSISTSGSLTVNGAPVSSFNTATLVTRAVSATSLVSGTSTFSVSSTGSVTLNNKPFVSGGIEFVFQNGGFNYTVDGFSSTFPALTVVRGQTYYFNLTNVTSSHPLALRLTSGNTSAVPGTTGNSPSLGSYGNGTSSTVVIYRVPFDAPTTIVYQCVVHAGMIGTINIVDQGSATTASFATTSGYALSFNTATLVASAVTATTVSGAAQPNITSVGTLTSLTVSGEIVAQKLTIQLTTVTTTLIKTDDIIQTTNNTASTGTTTGALVIAGGVGIGGDLYVGGLIGGLGNSKLDLTTYGANSAYLTTTGDDSTALFMGAVSVDLYAHTNINIRTNTGGTATEWAFGDDGSLTAPGKILVQSTASSTSTTTGALIVSGGVGIGGGVFVGGTVTATNFILNGYQVSTSTSGITATSAPNVTTYFMFNSNTSFAMTQNLEYVIPFDTAATGNDAGDYDTSTKKFTPTIGGWYLIQTHLNFSGVWSGNVEIILYKNSNAEKIIGTSWVGNGGGVGGSALVFLNGSGDFMEIAATQKSGGVQALEHGTTKTWFQATWLKT